MGKVYLAEQRLGTATRRVAIKTLRPELSNNAQVVGRFLRECEIVAQLHHPNTVQFFDFGELEIDGSGGLFIVMEYIEGEDLGALLDREGPLELGRIDRLLIQIAGSLSEAHQLGVVHRDLKPDNILLTERAGQPDFVKVLDFGIARHHEMGEERTQLTMQGMVLGTPPYMSPEQFGEEAPDARSDLYSLGIILYEMLTGRLPFEAKTPWEWANRHLSEPPLDLAALERGSALPEHRRRAVMRALSKDPAARQRDIIELLEEFTGIASGQEGWLLTAQRSLLPERLPEHSAEDARELRRASDHRAEALDWATKTSDDDDDDDDDELEALIEPPRMGRAMLFALLLIGALFAGIYLMGGPEPREEAGRELGQEADDEHALAHDPSAEEEEARAHAQQDGATTEAAAKAKAKAERERGSSSAMSASSKAKTASAMTRRSAPRARPVQPAGAPQEDQRTESPAEAPSQPAAESAPPSADPGTISRPASDAASSTTSGASASTIAAGEALLREGRAAMEAQRFIEAGARLNEAEALLGADSPAYLSARRELGRLGERAVGNELMRGRCDEAQALFRDLQRANAHQRAAAQFTGDWCPRP